MAFSQKIEVVLRPSLLSLLRLNSNAYFQLFSKSYSSYGFPINSQRWLEISHSSVLKSSAVCKAVLDTQLLFQKIGQGCA